MVMPYWFLQEITFSDSWNEHSVGLLFHINDTLLVFQLFLKLMPSYNYLLELTKWTDPKAQRCC